MLNQDFARNHYKTYVVIRLDPLDFSNVHMFFSKFQTFGATGGASSQLEETKCY